MKDDVLYVYSFSEVTFDILVQNLTYTGMYTKSRDRWSDAALISFRRMLDGKKSSHLLLLLVAILTKPLLALVCRDLVTLTLLSAWHSRSF